MSTATVVLRKRNGPRIDTGVLHLSSSPSPGYDTHSDSDFEPENEAGSSLDVPETSTAGNNKIVLGKRKYPCPFAGCSKSYSKPSRLAEHERSHSGDRPFVCTTCNKSYSRESHLQAHSRSHLAYSERPYVCQEAGCSKRFWTTQHLRVHIDLHMGEKPFKCTQESCTAAFMKHHQLREHVCTVHAPPGTKPYRCEHAGCTKSFATNQKLRTHTKTHDDKRYTCSHASCLIIPDASRTYYATWTALQHHMRTAHPPTCPYSSCNGRIFSAQKGLRAHLKIHEQREVEQKLVANESDDEDDPDEPPRKRRRGGDVGRDWICDVPQCGKDFKSKKALTTHHNITHLGRRDFICPHESCKRAFGYKHLLQRHLAKLHAATSDLSDSTDEEAPSSPSDIRRPAELSIDDITGKNYSVRSRQLMMRPNVLRCPYPDLHDLTDESSSSGHRTVCEYVFSRGYDLRRHLQSEHSITVEKERIDSWVKASRKAKDASQNCN